MRINYFSDIHLEFGISEIPDNDADVVVAAGDIGPDLQGMEWLKKINKPVFYVAGNHEFYDHEYLQVLNRLRGHAQGTQVHFLENSMIIHQNVRFLGCTLWADLFIDGVEKVAILARTLNDFKQISIAKELFNPIAYSKIYTDSKLWLQQELARPFQGKTVVITHHAPSEWSWNRAPNATKKLAYCNDLKFLLHEYPIDAWFHGHVHNEVDYRIAGARILCNPRGYFGRKLVTEFELNRIVEI